MALENHQSKNKNITVSYQLYDGATILLEDKTALLIDSHSNSSVSFKKEIENIKQWSAEHPNLHTLLTTIKNKKGVI
ncbi:hypothetical protein [Lacinutrix jangbogonensis]|uniref:hypothetical protein n=1 Tax=Lacinutrix jangbogonensis TaxID=1469557 RepID=UPI001F14ADEF|nr:hypothetical protein [Lacinutrix jangbogonensis]